MIIDIINKTKFELPKYETMGSAGMDLRSTADVVLEPHIQYAVPTGIYISLPVGYEAQIRARSGLAAKYGISLVNGVGTVDSDFRGEIKAIMINLTDTPYIVNCGDRIAQMVINKYERINWNEVDTLDETERGAGGFGHTGNK